MAVLPLHGSGGREPAVGGKRARDLYLWCACVCALAYVCVCVCVRFVCGVCVILFKCFLRFKIQVLETLLGFC